MVLFISVQCLCIPPWLMLLRIASHFKMYLKCVNLTADVFLNCLQLAFSNEKQEVMGLLIGQFEENDDETVNANISHLFIPQRADRKCDRVETSPEQLMCASVEAETLSKKLKKEVRVIGWFHSHPHITVLPSHIDVNTQATYQLMERGFVGIICSVFNTNTHMENQIRVTCFQSELDPKKGTNQAVKIPFHILHSPAISYHSYNTMVDMQNTLNTEDLNDYEACMSNIGKNDFLTKFQNDTVLAQAFIRNAQVLSQPLYTAMMLKHKNNQNEIFRLTRELRLLEEQEKNITRRKK